MSLPMDITEKCAVCGKESLQTTLMSTNTFGGTPDLDLRPPEMMRSTMRWWVQECPHCGYVSGSVDDKPAVKLEWLKSEKFTSCGGRKFESDLAKRFYKQYLINVEACDEKGAFFAVLHAAWACDDAGDTDNAVYCRKCALTELEKLQEPDEELVIVKADLLRRTEQFDKLIAEYEGVCFTNDLHNDIIAFQIDKAQQKDTRRYRIMDVRGLPF